jgi:CRISPR type IV-associated protein Csf2
VKTYLFEGILTALTSVSHIGESYGIVSKLRREKIVSATGEVEEIPIISGNSLRGILRDRGMLHMLKILGYGINESTGEIKGLSLAAFYFLFSGGSLTKIKGKGLDIDEARKWRKMIPLVSLFGGAMGNQIMPGSLKCGKAIPICEETTHLLPEKIANNGSICSVWELIQEESYTRRDDEKNEKLRQLINPDTRNLLEAEARTKREKSGTKLDVAGDTGQKQQMRYHIETLAAGTKFFWDMTLDDVTDIEFEAFITTIADFMRYPFIGGKSGTGLGKVTLKFDGWKELTPVLERNGLEIDFSLGTRYADHLEKNGDKIRDLLNGLS